MAAPMEHSKLSKAERKRMKKHTRSQKNLWARDGIQTSEVPTKILCVCNAGLDNGVSREEVQHFFSSHGNLEEVIMLPRKPYAFVCYTDEEGAQQAHTALNGVEVQIGEDHVRSVTFHIFYVSKAPHELSPSLKLPSGLIVLEDFIDGAYEENLLQSICWEESSQTAQQKTLKHRRVKHYGYEFKYGINNVDPDEPLPQGIPDVCKELLDKAIGTGHVKHFPDQLTINEYHSGQGIPPHVDTPSAFEDGLMSLSLGSQAVMEFHHPDGAHLSVLLPPRSLVIMTGESRYIWSHAITPRKSDIISTAERGLTLVRRGTRTSFTFRKLTGVKPEDTSAAEKTSEKLPETESDAADLEKVHVHEVYEKIAGHFSGTRHTPWPRIASFLKNQPFGSLLVDIGCGNGKYFGINDGLYEIGSDRSANLAQICCERGFQVFTGDVLAIPLRSGVFDVCMCIAVIHHLSTQSRRQKALSEILRVLRSGGKAVIYVWAFEQELHKIKSKYLKEIKHDENNDVESPVMVHDQQATNDQAVCETPKFECKNDKSAQELSTLCDSDKLSSVLQSDVPDNKDSIISKLEANKISDNDNSFTEPRTNFETDDHNDKLSIHVNRTKFKQQDMLVPWKLKNNKKDTELMKTDNSNTTCFRYYHMFRQGDLEKLCDSCSQCKIIENYYDQGNWAVILEKI
ncbi:hypothetical protein ScPMuIL_010118 [Solemya velum]